MELELTELAVEVGVTGASNARLREVHVKELTQQQALRRRVRYTLPANLALRDLYVTYS